MRIVYHYPMSPFSRRVRLALAHKGLDHELRDARSDPALLDEARRLVPQKTVPVFVDGGRALGDSTAITRWLDAAYPSAPRIWPEGADALPVVEIATLMDLALNTIIDLGSRYFELRSHASWGAVKGEMLERAQRALDVVGERLTGLEQPTVAASGWSAGDIRVVTAVVWIEGMPARAAQNQTIAQLLSLGGWRIPEALRDWTDQHRERPDVQAL